MGIFDKYFGFSNQNRKKFNSDLLIDFLTISNSVLNKYPNQRLIELEIFGTEIVDRNVPEEFQEEQIAKGKYFNKRYRLSSNLIGIAIIEAIIRKRFGHDLYSSELIELKSKIFSNLLKLREEIIKDIEFFESDYDWRYIDNKINLKNDSASFLQFQNFTFKLSNEVLNLISDNGEYHNLLFYFDSGLGQIIGDSRLLKYRNSTKNIVKNLINQVWTLLDDGFRML